MKTKPQKTMFLFYSSKKPLLTAILSGVLLMFSSPKIKAIPINYEIVKLSTPSSYVGTNPSYTYANAINDDGLVTGTFGGWDSRLRSVSYKTFVYQNSESFEVTGGETGPGASRDINNKGDLLIGSRILWNDGSETILGFMGKAINDNGSVAGWNKTYINGSVTSYFNPFYPTNPELLEFNTINNNNIPAGTDSVGSVPTLSPHEAFKIENDQIVYLPVAVPGSHARLKSMNDLGVAVGWTGNYGCFWDENNQIHLLARGFNPRSVNNLNQIVGEKNDGHAWIYENGEFVNLNDFLGANSEWDHLSWASDINNRGQIVGSGYLKNEESWTAFLMNPIPEPTSIILFTFGGLLVRRTRK